MWRKHEKLLTSTLTQNKQSAVHLPTALAGLETSGSEKGVALRTQFSGKHTTPPHTGAIFSRPLAPEGGRFVLTSRWFTFSGMRDELLLFPWQGLITFPLLYQARFLSVLVEPGSMCIVCLLDLVLISFFFNLDNNHTTVGDLDTLF